MYNIQFYENAHGISPINLFLTDLDQRAKTNKDAKIQLKQFIYQMDLLAETGTFLPSEYVKHIHEDIWELRPGTNRVLFFSCEGNNLILLHVFRKTTGKTPSQEIKKAERELEDWKNRHGNGKGRA